MRTLNEAKTREEKIDPALAKAGWILGNRSQVRFEISVDGENAEPLNGITDYSLSRPNGDIIAVVEAKRMAHDPRLAQQQAEHYVTEIARHQSFRPPVRVSDEIHVRCLPVISSEARNLSACQGFLVGTSRLLEMTGARLVTRRLRPQKPKRKSWRRGKQNAKNQIYRFESFTASIRYFATSLWSLRLDYQKTHAHTLLWKLDL